MWRPSYEFISIDTAAKSWDVFVEVHQATGSCGYKSSTSWYNFLSRQELKTCIEVTNPALRNTIYRKALVARKNMTVTQKHEPTCHKSANTKTAQAQLFFCQLSQPPAASPQCTATEPTWGFFHTWSISNWLVSCSSKEKKSPSKPTKQPSPSNTVHSFSDNLYMLVKLTQSSENQTCWLFPEHPGNACPQFLGPLWSQFRTVKVRKK